MTNPTILAFDTSAAHCAAALLLDGRIDAYVEEMKRGQAERLMPLLDELLQRNGSDWSALDAIAVGVGPGNFTGIRIGVSAARGLALGLGKPAIGVSTLEAQVFQKPRPVTACIPAPRDMAYFQEFTEDGTERPFHGAKGEASVELPSPEELVTRMVRIAAERLGSEVGRPTPLYIRPADAAPSKTPSPIIVP